jgi:hypothetical protein
MLDITHLQYVPLPFFNELEEVRVWSHMGPSMYDFFNESREGKLNDFSCLESLKRT